MTFEALTFQGSKNVMTKTSQDVSALKHLKVLKQVNKAQKVKQMNQLMKETCKNTQNM